MATIHEYPRPKLYTAAMLFGPRTRLLIAPYAALAGDVALTLLRQDESYWSGSYELANESEIIGLTMLRLHPVAFMAWIATWAILLGLLMIYTPRPLARLVCVAAALLHTFALLTWIQHPLNPYLIYALGILSAALIVYSLAEKTPHAPPDSPIAPDITPSASREIRSAK